MFIVLITDASVTAGDGREHVLTAWDTGAVKRALAGAAARLEAAECEGLLDEFTDRRGRPLRDRLDELGLDVADYLQTIAFRSGASVRNCWAEGVVMAAHPGRSIVYVCAAPGRAQSRLALSMDRDRDFAEIAIIHEMLHTLGLGENPPSSHEITQRVRRRCPRGGRRASR
jgi:hypothetical protein